MGLMLIRKKDGGLKSQWWYGSHEIGGTKKVFKLGVPVTGKVPASLRDSGDAAFEQSRGKAQGALDGMLYKLRERQNEVALTERLIELKTGGKPESVLITDLPTAWCQIPRKRQPVKQHLEYGKTVLRRFADHMQAHHAKVIRLDEIRAEHVRGFLERENQRGLSARTWNETLGFLRCVFRHFEPTSEAYRKYLANLPTKEGNTIHRAPFTPEEIRDILAAAQNDDLMRPLIVTALCTAMRRGDCCQLKWKDVDLAAGFIRVKTSKTGETVEIPIMPILNAELVQRKQRGMLVFPEAAQMYQTRPDAIDNGLQRILAQAGFVSEKMSARLEREKNALPALSPDETRRKGLSAILAAEMSDGKRDTMQAIFKAYLTGQTVGEIAANIAVSKSTVSCHLNEIARMINAAVIRRPGLNVAPTVRGLITARGEGPRLKAASVRGWHSFRTTFITLALSAGMPMELVRRVTGHTTVDVVLKYYFRPGREQFRQAMQAAMPKLLTAGAPSPAEQVKAIVENMTAKTWRADRQRVLALLKEEIK